MIGRAVQPVVNITTTTQRVEDDFSRDEGYMPLFDRSRRDQQT